MAADDLFRIANLIAMAAWLLLIAGGRVRAVPSLVTGAVVPLLFAILYTALIVAAWGTGEGGFGSIAAVRQLFSNDWLLLAGWVHYLAFDLFVGSWQVRDAQAHGIPHWLLIPGLVLTLLFGPAGWLVYAVIRVARIRTLSLAS